MVSHLHFQSIQMTDFGKKRIKNLYYLPTIIDFMDKNTYICMKNQKPDTKS